MILLLFYLILTLPFRWAIKKTLDYDKAIRLRKLCHVLLYFFVGIAIVTMILNLLSKVSFENKNELVVDFLFLFFFMPVYYYWVKSLLNVVDYYDESIISELRFYVLYLRSFKDDQRRDKVEWKCMETIYNLFCPFAVLQRARLEFILGINGKSKLVILCKKLLLCYLG